MRSNLEMITAKFEEFEKNCNKLTRLAPFHDLKIVARNDFDRIDMFTVSVFMPVLKAEPKFDSPYPWMESWELVKQIQTVEKKLNAMFCSISLIPKEDVVKRNHKDIHSYLILDFIVNPRSIKLKHK